MKSAGDDQVFDGGVGAKYMVEEVEEFGRETVAVREDYMDQEFNDSPFDFNGSALFWMW